MYLFRTLLYFIVPVNFCDHFLFNSIIRLSQAFSENTEIFSAYICYIFLILTFIVLLDWIIYNFMSDFIGCQLLLVYSFMFNLRFKLAGNIIFDKFHDKCHEKFYV